MDMSEAEMTGGNMVDLEEKKIEQIEGEGENEEAEEDN